MSLPVVAVIVAAGLGLRYGGPTPKPVLKLTGRALIAMSIEAMSAGGCTDAIVVINPRAANHFNAALTGAPIPVRLTPGGDTRQESVHAGLKVVAADPRLATARYGEFRVDDPLQGQGSGYGPEIREVERCLRAGFFESPLVPHTDTIAILELLDRARKDLGVVYPGEHAQ